MPLQYCRLAVGPGLAMRQIEMGDRVPVPCDGASVNGSAGGGQASWRPDGLVNGRGHIPALEDAKEAQLAALLAFSCRQTVALRSVGAAAEHWQHKARRLVLGVGWARQPNRSDVATAPFAH